MQPNPYLKDLVGETLAARGLPGSVEIRPDKPLAARIESGERAHFVVEYHGVGDAHLIVDEWQISSGTRGARVADALADMIERAIERRIAA